MYIFLIVGLFFVLSGFMVPEPSVKVTEYNVSEEQTYENLSPEDIQEIEQAKDEYQPGDFVANNISIIQEYNFNEYSNETQNQLISLVNNEEEYILNDELPPEKFNMNINNTTHTFEGELSKTNPIYISLVGYFILFITFIIYHRINKKESESDDVSLHDLRAGTEDEEWRYIIKDNKK